MKTCFCSWSGGKDSCLALYKSKQVGYKPKFILTTFLESGHRTHSHGLAAEILQAQAASMILPLVACNTSWQEYRNNFIDTFRDASSKIAKVTTGVFGDIDIVEHREWVKKLCAEIDCKALLPLWQFDRKELLNEFIRLGFKAIVVAVASDIMNPAYLGNKLDHEFLEKLSRTGIDPSGENGEYHTVVIDGPLFSFPIKVIKQGAPQLRSGYWYQDYKLLVE